MGGSAEALLRGSSRPHIAQGPWGTVLTATDQLPHPLPEGHERGPLQVTEHTTQCWNFAAKAVAQAPPSCIHHPHKAGGRMFSLQLAGRGSSNQVAATLDDMEKSVAMAPASF